MALIQSPQIQSNLAFKPGVSGCMFVRKAVIDLPATHALDDVIQCVKVFAGETLYALRVVAEDLDSNGSPAIVLDFGYGNTGTTTGANSAAIIDGSTIGQAGGIGLVSALSSDDDGIEPIAFTADTTIDCHIQVGAATAAAGKLTVYAFLI